MLTGCRHICVAWAAIGLLTLVTGIAASQGDLARVGAFALIAFGTLRLAMASDDFGAVTAWFAYRRGLTPPPPLPAAPPTPRGFWSRPAPYILLPLTAFVVLVGRVLMRPPIGEDARYLITGVMAAALTLTVVYLSLLAAEGAHAGTPSSAVARPDPNTAPRRTKTAADDGLAAMGALDTAQFTRDVLDVEHQGGPTRP